MVRPFLLILLTPPWIITLIGCDGSSVKPTTPIVTASEFRQLEDGMSYDQAVGVIGEPGVVESSRSYEERTGAGMVAPVKETTYVWRNPDGSSARAAFKSYPLSGHAGGTTQSVLLGAGLIHKYQYGLMTSDNSNSLRLEQNQPIAPAIHRALSLSEAREQFVRTSRLAAASEIDRATTYTVLRMVEEEDVHRIEGWQKIDRFIEGSKSEVQEAYATWKQAVKDSSKGSEGGILAFYYDLGTGEYFTDSWNTVPPITNPATGNEAVRAHFFTCGDCTPENRFCGYLEKFTPERKKHLGSYTPVSEDKDVIFPGRLYALPPSESDPKRADSWVDPETPAGVEITNRLRSRCKTGKIKYCNPY